MKSFLSIVVLLGSILFVRAQYGSGQGSYGTIGQAVSPQQVTNVVTSVIYSSILETNFVDDTNNLYVTGAGTAAANGHYGFKQNAFTSGWVFTNFTGVGFFCKDLGGVDMVVGDENPYYISSTTNNHASTQWYYSPINERINWLNNSTIFGPLLGSLPNPSVRYGTNAIITTNTFIVQTSMIQALRRGKTVLVDQTNGCDAGALLGLCPFRTLTAAKNFATNGWVVYVNPGVYNENNLLKNQVDWNFQKGAICGFTDVVWQTNSISMFDDRAGAITSNISADLIYYYSQAEYCASVFGITNPATSIHAKFTSANIGYNASQVITPSGIVTNLVAQDFATVFNCSYLKLEGDSSTATTLPTDTRLDTNENSPTYGQIISVNRKKMGFLWKQGEEYIDIALIDADTAYQGFLWTDGPATIPSETSVYLHSHKVNGHFYDDAFSSLSKVWMDIDYLNGDSTAVTLLGKSLVYLYSEKISSPGNTIQCATSTNIFYLFTEKITSPLCWINGVGGQTMYVNCHNFDGNGTINISGGTNFITGLSAITTNNLLNISGGLLTVDDLTMDASGGSNYAVRVSGGTLSLNGVTLLSTNFSAYASTPQTVTMNSVSLNQRMTNINVNGDYVSNGVFAASSGLVGNGFNVTNLANTNMFITEVYSTNWPVLGQSTAIVATTNIASFGTTNLQATAWQNGWYTADISFSVTSVNATSISVSTNYFQLRLSNSVPSFIGVPMTYVRTSLSAGTTATLIRMAWKTAPFQASASDIIQLMDWQTNGTTVGTFNIDEPRLNLNWHGQIQ